MEDMKSKMTGEEWESVYKMSQDKNPVQQPYSPASSPTILGNDEVKRGIIWLMLFGGVPRPPQRHQPQGDHQCVCGERPSTAKSQFLKMVLTFPELSTPVVEPAARLG